LQEIQDLRRLQWVLCDTWLEPLDWYGELEDKLYEAVFTIEERAGKLMREGNYKDAEYILSQTIKKFEECRKCDDGYHQTRVLSHLVTLAEKTGNFETAEAYQERLLYSFAYQSESNYNEEVELLDRLYTLSFLRMKDFEFGRPSEMAELARTAVFRRAALLEIDEVNRKIIKNDLIGLPAYPLHLAAYVGARKLAKALLDEFDYDVNSRDEIGSTPLHKAVQKDRTGMLEIFLGAEVDLEISAKDGRTALHEAVRSEALASIEMLLDAGASPEAVCQEGKTALHYVVDRLSRNEVILQLLLERGASVNAKDCHGRTALIMTTEGGKLSPVQLLLDHGAEIDSRDETGMTPLHSAVAHGSEAMVNLLIQTGADLGARDWDARTALHIAVSREDGWMNGIATAILKTLLQSEADKEAVNASGETALVIAVKRKDLEKIRILFDYGANVNGRDYLERTPLFLAVQNNAVRTVGVLLDYNAKTDFVYDDDFFGSSTCTLLHIAIRNSNFNIVKSLLGAGADANKKGRGGATSLHEAIQSAREPQDELILARLLRHEGVDVHAQNEEGNTPLHLAVFLVRLRWVKVLLAAQEGESAHLNVHNILNFKGLSPITMLDEIIRFHEGFRMPRLIQMRNSLGNTSMDPAFMLTPYED